MKTVLDDDGFRALVEYMCELGGDKPSYTRLLGVPIESPDFDHPRMRWQARDEYVGSHYFRVLHGGIIASFLDAVGGHAVWLSVFKQIRDLPFEKQLKRVSRISSIDLRIDYLQPGKGEEFIASATILRTGNKVAVTRMELRNEKDELIAVGTGTYTVG